MEIICFHNPDEENGYLGNWYLSEFEVNGIKFSQNEELKEKLIATKDVILAECAVKDQIWGIGLSMKDENRFDMDKWRGQNLLGYALMMVREQFIK